MRLIERVLEHLADKREKVTARHTDVVEIIKAQDTGNWTQVHASRFYNSRPVEYCQLLECIEVERMKALEIAKQILMKINTGNLKDREEDLAWLEDNSFILDGEFAQLVPDQRDVLFLDMVDGAIIKLMRKAEKL